MPAGSNNQLDFRPPSPAGDNGQDHHHEVERKSLFNRLFERGAIDDGDTVIISKGDLVGKQGGTNAMKILRVGEDEQQID